MVKIIYEDSEILVAEKPAGLESQAIRKFEPDMVSEIRNYLVRSQKKREREQRRELSTKPSTSLSTPAAAPYVGVIHRLDKPVSGVMVYAKTRSAAAFLSSELQAHRVTKIYHAVVCGKPVDNVGNFVDNLYMNREENYSVIVDKSKKEGKRAELSYRVLSRAEEKNLTLLEIQLKTGRHHQIRVQLAGHGLPIWGDARYNPQFGGTLPVEEREEKGSESFRTPASRGPLALAAVSLSFTHPSSGKKMTFSIKPASGAFRNFVKERG